LSEAPTLVGAGGVTEPGLGSGVDGTGYPAIWMKFLRRAFSAIFMRVLAAAVLRVKGTGGTPPQHGGWRPLELPER
jgi:hypothetical protein